MSLLNGDIFCQAHMRPQCLKRLRHSNILVFLMVAIIQVARSIMSGIHTQTAKHGFAHGLAKVSCRLCMHLFDDERQSKTCNINIAIVKLLFLSLSLCKCLNTRPCLLTATATANTFVLEYTSTSDKI